MKVDGTISTISRIREHANELIEYELGRRGHKGLATSHGNILSVLLFQGEMTKKDISTKVGKDRSTVTVLLRKLKKLGYVEERVNEKDNRSSIVSLSEQGKAMKQDFVDISEILYSTQYHGLNDKEIKEFTRLLAIVDKNFISQMNNRK